MKTKPNLFEYATSELSQDAFLCWLLKWADEEMSEDPVMHDLGIKFVELLYRGHAPPRLPAQMKIGRQMKRADVVVAIGADDVLVVEDKVHAHEHGDQLAKYKGDLQSLSEFRGRRFQWVFLKTGDQSSYAAAEENGWTVVRRSALLEILSVAYSKTDNVILRDFHDHLLKEESDMNVFGVATRAQWEGKEGDAANALKPQYLWKGFFASIQGDLEGHWGYVPNAAGGFVGFWWAFQALVEGHQLYLQLEQQSLVVKMKAAESAAGDRKAIQREWSEKVLGKLAAVGLKKPRVLRSGATMTLAKIDDYRVWADSRLDRDATLANLKTITSAFKHAMGN